MQKTETREDAGIEQAKGRLSQAIVYLEASVKKRIDAAAAEVREAEVPANMVNTKLVQALQDEVARLKQENASLRDEVENMKHKYQKVREAGEVAADTLDNVLEDLMAYRG